MADHGGIDLYFSVFEHIIDNTEKEISKISPSDWAETKRVMTSDVSAIMGKFKFEHTPYTREILDCLSADHPARTIAVMKGAQIGFSTSVIENAIGWIIDQSPANILFLVGHDDLVKDSMKKVDTMIDSCGIRTKIKSTTKRIRNTKSGDTDKMKEFAGGYLKLGITNHKSLRNISIKYAFIDDFESMKGDTKESGDTTKMIAQRLASYAQTMKLFYISTPEVKESSNIEPVYLLGDQRKYHVPCPHCGEFIELLFFGKYDGVDNVGGIVYELDEKGQLIDDSVGYCCQECNAVFDDSNKFELINKGKWIPTAEPSRPNYFSYQINALCAPPSMFGWNHYVRDYLEACPPDQPRHEKKYQTFVNLVLGETYQPERQSIDPNQLQRNIRNYEIGVIPDTLSELDGNGKIVLLTCGVDLNGKLDDARIDFEVVGYSESGATYSIDHGSFGTFQRWAKDTDRKKYTYQHGMENSVWTLLDQYLQKKFTSDDEKRSMRIALTSIDAGYQTDYAYQFRNQTNAKCICVKGGDDAQKFISSNANLKTWKHSKEMPQKLFLMESNYTKDVLSRHMNLKWNKQSDTSAPEGFLFFPTPSQGKYLFENYFSHFSAEEKSMSPDGKLRWSKKSGKVENHLFDCRLYSIIAKDVLIDFVCKENKIKAISWFEFVQLLKPKKK